MSTLNVTAGTTVIDTFAKSRGAGANWQITAKNGANVRIYDIEVVWDDETGVNQTYVKSNTVTGTVENISFSASISGDDVILEITTGGTWELSIKRTII